MALLKAEAEKLSNNDLVRGVIEEIIDREALWAMLPFVESKGKAYVYNRESTLSEPTFIDPNEAVTEGAATFTSVTTYLKILAGDVDVDKFLDSTMDDTNGQKAIQIAAKAKALGRAFKRTLIQGNSNSSPKEFDGLDRMLAVTANRVLAGANGAALTLAMLDDLCAAVPNGPDFLLMRQGTFNAVKVLWRAAGGNDGAIMQLENFGISVPAHDGIPILINDFILGDVDQGSAPSTCSIYAVRANEIDGVHGIYGGGQGGFVIEDIGTVQNKDATRTRLKWYCGTALKSTKSLASLYGVTNV